MAIFQPLDPRYAEERRKRLAARITGQTAAAGHPAVGGVARLFRGALGAGRSPFANLTFDSFLPPGLADKLGPGGVGTPGAGQFSPGRGMPAYVPPPVPRIPPPTPTPSVGGGASSPAPPPSSSGGIAPIDNSQTAGAAGGVGPISNSQTAGASGFGGSMNLIPLGGGVYLDPSTGQILGHGSVL
jgi:hypothetical protein